MNRSQEIIKNHSIFKQICRYYGAVREKTYYDVLGISRNASKQDIRLAYLKLSKEKHPDKNFNENKESHDDFVKINEAYNVLSKNDLKEHYDTKLRSGYSHSYASSRSRSSVYGPERYDMYDTYYNVTMNVNRKNAKYKYANSSTLRVWSKTQMVFFCIMIWMFGNIFHVWAVMKSPTFNRKSLLDRSRRFGNEEEKVRIKARENMQVYDDNAAIALALFTQLHEDDPEDGDKKI